MTACKKNLEGIRRTKELQALLDKTFALLPSNHTTKENNESSSIDNINDVIEEALQSMSNDESIITLNEFRSKELACSEKNDWLPIPVIQAMESILNNTQYAEELQLAVKQSGGLVFSPIALPFSGKDINLDDPGLTKEQRKFQQRLARLRLKTEETKYSKITTNLGMTAVTDDVTTKSMTYAASIGLNMIIAPLSFGCLMYFFAGSILDYFWKREFDERTKHYMANQPDIRKVIAGVVSGVVMLFIEMILFVIRTHELDTAARRKKKKAGIQPFGHYSTKTSRTFVKTRLD